VFKSRLKVCIVGADANEYGRAFQACAAATRERPVAECWTAGDGYDQLWCCRQT